MLYLLFVFREAEAKERTDSGCATFWCRPFIFISLLIIEKIDNYLPSRKIGTDEWILNVAFIEVQV